MKRLDRWPELGVRFIERHIEKENFSGRASVVETVSEYEGDWEGKKTLYRYAVHWTIDDETFEIRLYDKFVANEAADRAAAFNRRLSIPRDPWKKMRSMAEQFLKMEEIREELAFLHGIVITRDPKNDSHIVVSFRTHRWSGYRMVYKEKNGCIQLIESLNHRALSEQQARKGHQRIPRSLCEAVFDQVSEYVKGKYTPKGNRQGEFELSVPSTSD